MKLWHLVPTSDNERDFFIAEDNVQCRECGGTGGDFFYLEHADNCFVAHLIAASIFALPEAEKQRRLELEMYL